MASGTDVDETVDIPRPTSLSFYPALLLFVVPIWSTVPLAYVFTAYSLYTGKAFLYGCKGTALLVAAICEVFFSIWHAQLVFSIPKIGTAHGPDNLVELVDAYSRVLHVGLADPRNPLADKNITQLKEDDPRAVDLRNSLRTWFGRAPWSQVRLHEIRVWVYWSIFNAELPPLQELSMAHRTVLDDAVERLQKRLGRPVPEGSNPNIRPMRLTMDTVNVVSRPFVHYMCVAIAQSLCRLWFKRTWQLRYGEYKGLEYMLRIPVDWKEETGPRPIVFIHGLGLGLVQYSQSVKFLLQNFGDRPLLIPLQPQVSQDIFHPRYLHPMKRQETTEYLSGLITGLGWAKTKTEGGKGVVMLSHSNGSYMHTWMLKDHPTMVASSCFVDPVSLCVWEGDVCYNFLYRPCKTGIELLMRFFVGTEIGIANLLQRNLCWSSNSLWVDEVPNAHDPSKTFFLLGGKDDIINAPRVKQYLESHGIGKGLWYDPEGRHGQALMDGQDGLAQVHRWLHEQR